MCGFSLLGGLTTLYQTINDLRTPTFRENVMKQSQFFEAVKFTRAEVVAIQEGSKGFKLVARVSHQGDNGEAEVEEITLTTTVEDETRYFKAVAALPLMLRANKVLAFSVELENTDIKKGKRRVSKPTAAAPAASTSTPARKTTSRAAERETATA